MSLTVTYSSTIILPQPTDENVKTASGVNVVSMEIDEAAMNQHQ